MTNSPHVQKVLDRKNWIEAAIKNKKQAIEDLKKEVDALEEDLKIFDDIVSDLKSLDITETPVPTGSKKNTDTITTVHHVNPQNETQKKIIDFLQSRPTHAARASEITDMLWQNNREIEKILYNSINLLVKYGKIAVVSERDALGNERQRNRLYAIK